MTTRSAVRWAIAGGWLLVAALLERILTLGAITDISGLDQNPPALVAIGGLLLVLGISAAVMVAADNRRWPIVSLLLSVMYLVTGIWLRLANDDDSASAIALFVLVIGIASARTVGERRRGRSPAAEER